MKFKIGAISLVLAATGLIAYAQNTQLSVSGFDVAVDGDGNIKLPDLPFRETWTQLGTWSVNGERWRGRHAHRLYATRCRGGVPKNRLLSRMVQSW